MHKTLLCLCLSVSLVGVAHASVQRDDDGLFDQSSIDQKSEQDRIVSYKNKVKSPGGWELKKTEYDKTNDTVKVEARKDNVKVLTSVKAQLPALIKWAKSAAGFLGNVFDLAKELLFGQTLNDYTHDHYKQIYPHLFGKYRYVSTSRHAFLDIAVSGRKSVYSLDDYFYSVSIHGEAYYYHSFEEAKSKGCGKGATLIRAGSLPSLLKKSTYHVSIYCSYTNPETDRTTEYSRNISLTQRIHLGDSNGALSLPKTLQDIIESQGTTPVNDMQVKAIGDYKRYAVENEFYTGALDNALDHLKSSSNTGSAAGTVNDPATAPSSNTGSASSTVNDPATAPSSNTGSASSTVNDPATAPSSNTGSVAGTVNDPATATTAAKDPAAEPFELPAFCLWATPVCQFMRWARQDPKLERQDDERPDIVDVGVTQMPSSFDLDYLNYGGQCPSLDAFSVPVGLGDSIQMQFDITPLCDFAVKVRPAILAIAYLLAMMIVGRAVQNS